MHTSANFERSKDQKTVAKVFVTCELSIGGLGTHSATGGEWADDENAGTSAEAQSFKRTCACFGLGRYLYHFDGVSGLDERKRPRTVPNLPPRTTAMQQAAMFPPTTDLRTHSPVRLCGRLRRFPRSHVAEHGVQAFTSNPALLQPDFV